MTRQREHLQMSNQHERAFDLAIAGELNMDLILYGLPREMPTECDLLGTGFVSTLGSSSAIMAHNASTLGLRVRFATLVGDDDFGRIALDRLAQAGVEISGAIVDPLVSTGVTILLPHGAERHCLTSPGSISALTVEHLRLDRLAQARHFHLSSLYVQTGLHPGIVDLLRSLKRMGLTISLDTNDDPENKWGPPLQEIFPCLDLFMPNEREIRRMAGGCGLDEALQAFEDKVPTIVVKRGPHGCRIQNRGQVFDIPGIPVDPVDTIGAGDSFDAGFLYAYLRGMPLMTCGRAGNTTGALSTLCSGGTEAFRDAVMRDSFLEKHGFPKQ